MSSGAKVTSYLVKETVPGVTPGSGWQTLRVTGNTLTPTLNKEESEEITESRLGQGSIVTSIDIGGDITGELSYGTFDDLLAAAFYGQWDANKLTVGETRSTFSVAKAYRDVDVYALFKGAHVSTFALEVPEEGKATVTFTMSCLDYEDKETPFATDPAEPSKTPFMSSISVGDVKANGVSLAGQACVSGLTVNIDNQLQTQRCFGAERLGPGALIETAAAITGTVTLAWSKKAWELWKNQFKRTPIAVSFPITDSLGNKYEIDLPAIEVDGDLPNGAKGDILKVELNFTVAKQAPVITRSPAATSEP